LNLDPFRLDVDEAMAQAQEQQREAEVERQKTRAVWQRIASELEHGGPFAALLTEFRQDATRALSDLVYADSNDSVRIASLQADVQRSLRTMEHIDEFQNAAQAADANVEGETLDDQ
jgi:hypothetical protein